MYIGAIDLPTQWSEERQHQIDSHTNGKRTYLPTAYQKWLAKIQNYLSKSVSIDMKNLLAKIGKEVWSKVHSIEHETLGLLTVASGVILLIIIANILL